MFFESLRRSSAIKQIVAKIQANNTEVISQVLDKWGDIYTGAEITSAIHTKNKSAEERLEWVAGRFRGIQKYIDVVTSQSSHSIRFPFREIKAFKLLQSFVETHHKNILIECFKKHYPDDIRIDRMQKQLDLATTQGESRASAAIKVLEKLDRRKVESLQFQTTSSLLRTASNVKSIAQGGSALLREESFLVRTTSREAFGGSDFDLMLLYYNNTKTSDRTTYMQLLNDIYKSPQADTNSAVKKSYEHIELYFDLVNIITTLGRYKTQLIDPRLNFNLITASGSSDKFKGLVKFLAFKMQHAEECEKVKDPNLTLVIFINMILDTTLKLINKWQKFIEGPLNSRLDDTSKIKSGAEKYLGRFKQQRNNILYCILDMMPLDTLREILKPSSAQQQGTPSQYRKG